MQNFARIRPAVILVAVLGIVVLGASGIALLASTAQDHATPDAAQAIDGGVCAADGVSEDMAPGANQCKDCKRPKGKHGCARLSCDPCCWVCEGEPLPLCTS